LCGLTGRNSNQIGLGLSGSVHEGRPSWSFLAYPNRVFKGVEAGSSNYLLIQLVPPIDHCIRKEIIYYSINIYKYTIIFLLLPLYGYLTPTFNIIINSISCRTRSVLAVIFPAAGTIAG